MLALSLVTVLEAAARGGRHGLAGDVTNLEELLDPDNLAKLKGVASAFAFLAFHPRTDNDLREYITSGGLLADSGPNVLVFFIIDEDASAPLTISDETFGSWISLQADNNPADQLVRYLFEPAPVPPLPGLVFFTELEQDSEAVYVYLGDDSGAEALRRKLRTVFSLADYTARTQPPQDLLGSLRVTLRRERIRYTTTKRMSLAEWIVSSYQFVSDHAWDIATLIKP